MAKFRHEEIAAVPRGYKVRTVQSGEHEIHLAVPPGRRRTGAGVLVEILHPSGENPMCKIANLVDPSKLELQRAARERAEKIRKARIARGPRFRDVGRGNNPDPASYTYATVYKSPETGRTIRSGGYWRKDAEKFAEYLRKALKKRYGKTVAVEVKPDKRGILGRIFNPDNLDEAVALYETFHGHEPNEVLRMHESAEQSGDYTGLGDLVELVFLAPNGEEVLVKFKNDGVRVASTPIGDRAQIYFFGGNQDISGHLNLFGIEDTGKVLLDLGDAKRIVYEAAKWQTDFTDQEWKHNFGEESGVRPRAFFRKSRGEKDPARIFLAGGNYRIERGGIVD